MTKSLELALKKLAALPLNRQENIFDLEDLEKSLKIMTRYQDLPLGLVDGSLLVMAERYFINQILTLDHRHFNLIQSDNMG